MLKKNAKAKLNLPELQQNFSLRFKIPTNSFLSELSHIVSGERKGPIEIEDARLPICNEITDCHLRKVCCWQSASVTN